MGRPSARGAVRCRRKPVQLGVSPGDGWILRHYLQVGVRGSHGVRRAVHRALPWRRGQCFCPGAGYRVGRNRALHARYDGARHSGGKRRIGAAPGRGARRQADGEGVFLLARGVWHLFHFKRRRNVSTGRVEPPVHRLRAGNGAPVRQRRARLRCAEAVQGKRVPEAVRRGSGRQGRGSSTAVVRPRVRRDGSAGSAADGLCRYPGVLLRGLAGGVLRLRMQGSCRARVRLDYRAAGRCEDARSVPFRSAAGQRVPGHLQRTGD